MFPAASWCGDPAQLIQNVTFVSICRAHRRESPFSIFTHCVFVKLPFFQTFVCPVFIYWVFILPCLRDTSVLCSGSVKYAFWTQPVITPVLRDASHRRGPRHSGKGWPRWRDAALWFGSARFSAYSHTSLAYSYTFCYYFFSAPAPPFPFLPFLFASIHQLRLALNTFCLDVALSTY